jgi:hypothetical protein
VDTFATGELADALDGLLAALGDHIGGAELAGQRDAVRVAAHDDDLLGAEPLGGDDCAQADGAVADDRGALARSDLGDDGGVVAGAHHVRQRQQRRHERVVLADGQRVEGAVCVGDTHGLSLGCTDAVVVEKAAVHAGGMQALAAEGAGAVREREGHHDQITLLDVADLGADVLDDADRLMAHRPPGLAPLQGCVGPQIAAADAGAGDAEDGVGGLLEVARILLLAFFPASDLVPVQESTGSGRVRVPVERGTGRVSQETASGSTLCNRWTRAARSESS